MAGVGVIVVAAGASSRMGGVDKVFVPLLGRPLAAHSLRVLGAHPEVDAIVFVVGADRVQEAWRTVHEGDNPKVTSVCPGGPRRQDSVACGLAALPPCEWVIVHDGARPCLLPDLVTRGLEAARETGAAVAAVPLVDTVKQVGDGGLVLETLPRESLWAVQTPQVFRRELLEDAHRRVHDDVTDDAGMVERLGHAVRVFQGAYDNLKVTTPGDLVMAEAILRARCAARG